jgi:hypothetical protein
MLSTLLLYGIAFLGLIALLVAATLIHELGHVATGLLAGFEIRAVRVGPVLFRRKDVQVWKGTKQGLTSGFVMAQFRQLPDRSAAWQCFAFIIGGPLANLLAAPVLLWLSFHLTIAETVCSPLSVACAFYGAINLIPMKTRIGYSDGAKVCWLLFNRRKRDEWILLLSIKARINSIAALAHHGQLDQAVSEAKNLLVEYRSSSLNNAKGIEALTGFQASLEKQFAGETPSPEAPSNHAASS